MVAKADGATMAVPTPSDGWSGDEQSQSAPHSSRSRGNTKRAISRGLGGRPGGGGTAWNAPEFTGTFFSANQVKMVLFETPAATTGFQQHAQDACVPRRF